MKESHEMVWRSAEGHIRDIGGSSSQPSGSGINRGLRRNITTRELKFQLVVLILTCSQQNRNQSKACSQLRILKRLKNSWRNSFTTMQYHSMPLIVVLTINHD